MRKLLSVISFLLIMACSSSEPLVSSKCKDTNCANYTSQAKAQTDFDADRECRNDLDRDNDGIAC